MFSEKLSLERQLSTLEVELQTERRALGRARLKTSKQSEADANIKAQLEEINRELTREKQQREKIEEKARSEAAVWERHRTTPEGKLDVLKNKMQDTQEQLKEAQERLETQNPTKLKASMIRPDEQEPSNSRKRKVARFEPHMTIATPGGVHDTKKAKRVSALPGDKSTFSITPYLNRISTAAESPTETCDGNEEEQRSEGTSRLKEGVDTGHTLEAVGQDTNAQCRALPNLKAAEPRSKHARYAPSLMKLPLMPNVVEADDKNWRDKSAGSNLEFPMLGARKNEGRKQKTLAPNREGTLFGDDDESRLLRKGRNSGFAAIRGLGARDARHHAVVPAKHSIGTNRSLGKSPEFSPLKRNKRLA